MKKSAPKVPVKVFVTEKVVKADMFVALSAKNDGGRLELRKSKVLPK